jgi:hypothetical protein
MNAAPDNFGPGGSAYGATHIHDLFFFDPPADDRFVGLRRRHFDPSAAVTQQNAIFKMQPTASVYLFNKIWLELGLKLETVSPSPAPPPENEQVGPVNNVLHSLISQVKISIKEVPITSYNEHYAYKSYLHQLLDYDRNTKKAQNRMQGWEDDTIGQFDSDLNAGWKIRQSYFVQSSVQVKTTRNFIFRADPVIFFGLLDTDIQELSQGLVPETPWELEIKFHPQPGFALWSKGVGSVYRLKVDSAKIHVWTGLLNARICTEIQHQLNKKAARYHFREMACVPYTIPKGTTSYETPLNILKVPGIKIYVAFVIKKAFDGDQVII